MTKDLFLPFMRKVTNIRDELEKLRRRRVEVEKRRVEEEKPRVEEEKDLGFRVLFCINFDALDDFDSLYFQIDRCSFKMTMLYSHYLSSLSYEEKRAYIGGRRVTDAIVVSTVFLLTFIYHYLVGYIDRCGSKAGASGPLDFRDTFISIDLFQAAYVWIKFRDVIPSIPRGAVYRRRGSSKWEVRIKFPVTRGVGGKSKRIPLGSYNSSAEGEVVYKIAAFYCKKRKHTGQLDLAGGAYFPIPALRMDPNLPYEEKVNQVGDQVMKVYAEFEERKASRNFPPSVSGPALEMPAGEGQLLASSQIQQLGQTLDSRMDLTMQLQGSQLGPNADTGVDFNDRGSLLLLHAETQHELLGAYKQQERLKAQVSRTEVENMGWEVKYSELERKYLELEQRNLQLEHENGLLNHQVLQSLLQTQHQEQDFDPDRFLMMGHEESLAR